MVLIYCNGNVLNYFAGQLVNVSLYSLTFTFLQKCREQDTPQVRVFFPHSSCLIHYKSWAMGCVYWHLVFVIDCWHKIISLMSDYAWGYRTVHTWSVCTMVFDDGCFYFISTDNWLSSTLDVHWLKCLKFISWTRWTKGKNVFHKDEGNLSVNLVQRLRKHYRTSVLLHQNLTTGTKFALVPVLEFTVNIWLGLMFSEHYCFVQH